jgi:hypothetical protein
MRIRCSTSYWLVLAFSCLTFLTNCGTVKSAVPGMGSDSSSAAKAGERLHFKVTPEEALAILVELAPQNGWEVVSTGDQYDLQGLRGKYFRLETTRFIGGRSSMSGVFFGEPTGTYVIVGKRDAGLPQDLAAPLIAAIEGRGKTAAVP